MIVNEYNNTYHRIIKMKPVDVKNNTYIVFGKEVNDKDPKFQIGDYERISKHRNSFAKGGTPNWKNILLSKKLKIQCHGHMLSTLLMVKKLLEHFMKRNAKNKSKEFRI